MVGKENRVRANNLNSILFLTFISLTFLGAIPASPKEAPQLAAEKSIYDFGTVREGMNVPVRFTVFNQGAKDVRIREIRTFAACVQSRPLEKKSLTPGESMTLDYIFQSLGYGGASVNKHIEIHYNNKKLSPLKLKVKGRVLRLESFQAPIGELTYNFFVLIDLRPPERFIKEHIIGAINVPFDEIERWVSAVSKSLSDELIIYLYSEDGKKSDEAAMRLREKGYEQCISLVGGLKEWKNQNGRRFLISGKL